MNFTELAKNRFSVRKFAPTKVEDEKITQILEAARVAPTAKNNQPQKILVLKSDEALNKLKACTTCHFDAPLAFIVCVDTSTCWQRPIDGHLSCDVDGAIVTTHIMLKATELNLGTCWVMFFDPNKVKEQFNLPSNITPVAIMPTGYKADGALPTERHTQYKPTEETVQIL